MTGPRVVMVGHCGPDAAMLSAALRRVVPGAAFIRVTTDAELRDQLPGASVLLVNRVLDGTFAARDGIELIRGVNGVRSILISNMPEAQEAAVAAGAMPGFGKLELYSEKARERLLAAVGGA